MTYRLLDLFCCEGGAGKGYQRAGFQVTGVDILPRFRKRYPGEFICADALEYVKEHGHEYDAIHASPPCQAYSITKHSHDNTHPELIEPVREALIATGKPYVIENVPGAPLLDPVTLCGAAFWLTATDEDGTRLVLKRHRLFESSFPIKRVPCECREYRNLGYRVAGAYGAGSSDKDHARYVRKGGYTPAKPVREALLGIDWMTLHGLSQSIPPRYAAYVGSYLRDYLDQRN